MIANAIQAPDRVFVHALKLSYTVGQGDATRHLVPSFFKRIREFRLTEE